MKKIKTTKRLNINRETLRELQLSEVTGAGSVISKPNASCFIQCVPTDTCPPTNTCPLATFNC